MGKSKRIRRWIAAAAGVCLTAVSAAADSLDLGGFQVEVEGEQEKPPVTAKPAEPPVPTQPPQPAQEPVQEPCTGACTGARSGARAGADTRACAGRDPCTGSGK